VRMRGECLQDPQFRRKPQAPETFAEAVSSSISYVRRQ
jgi:hypothetical protein